MFRSRVLLAALVIVCTGPLLAADPDVSADEVILRGAKIATDGPGLLEFFRQRMLVETDAAKMEALIEKLASGKFRERERATAELLRIGVPARPHLIKVQQHKDIEVRRRVEECLAILDRLSSPEVESAAVRVLRARRPAGTSAVLLAILPAVRDAGVEEEVQSALLDVGVKNGKADDELVKALRDRETSRRVAAVLVTGRSGSEPQREQVRQLLRNDPEMLVRLRAAQGLIAGKDVKAVAALLPLLTDAPLDLAVQTHDLLGAVSADKGPQRSLDANSRAKCREEWQAWWKDNEKKIDLARADVDLPWLNGNGRAIKAAMQFLDCILKGDGNGIKKLVDVPFHVGGVQVIDNRAMLEQLLGQINVAAKDTKMQFSAPRLLDARKFAAKARTDPAREFYKKVPLSELRVVYVVATHQGRAKGEPGAVLVRLRAGKALVIGLDQVSEEK